MFARQIRHASLAFAALALALATSFNVTPAAAAASGPDLEVKVVDYQIYRNAGDGGGAGIAASIKNVGDTKSAATIMYKSCGYLPAPAGGRALTWLLVDPLHQLVPALDPGKSSPNTDFYCPVDNGRVPVAYRIYVAPLGEANTANNKLTSWIFRFDP